MKRLGRLTRWTTSAPRAALLGAPSYALVVLTSLAGVVATFVWWRRADHTT